MSADKAEWRKIQVSKEGTFVLMLVLVDFVKLENISKVFFSKINEV